MRVLICGGRKYGTVAPDTPLGLMQIERARALKQQDVLNISLSPYRPVFGTTPATRIIHGGASGADQLAADWARKWAVPVWVYRPDWEKHGRAAGPLRNARMIAEGRPDIVIAFPGGRGTADCIGKARAAGIDVVEVQA